MLPFCKPRHARYWEGPQAGGRISGSRIPFAHYSRGRNNYQYYFGFLIASNYRRIYAKTIFELSRHHSGFCCPEVPPIMNWDRAQRTSRPEPVANRTPRPESVVTRPLGYFRV